MLKLLRTLLRKILGLKVLESKDLKPGTLVIYRRQLGIFDSHQSKMTLIGEHDKIRVKFFNPQTPSVFPAFHVTKERTIHWYVPNPPRYPNFLEYLLHKWRSK